MLEAKFRDSSLKCRKFRNKGLTTGTLKRKNGEIIPISMIIYKLDAYLNRNGFEELIEINFEGEILKAKIKQTQKDIVNHNVINIDLLEV